MSVYSKMSVESRLKQQEYVKQWRKTSKGKESMKKSRKRWLKETFSGWVRRTYISIRIRCRMQGHTQDNHKHFNCYKGIRLEMSLIEFREWCKNHESDYNNLLLLNEQPSLDGQD